MAQKSLDQLGTQRLRLTSVPGRRETHRAETSPLFRSLKFLPREHVKLLLMCRYSSVDSPQGFSLQ